MGEFDITTGIPDATGIHLPDNYASGFKAPPKGGSFVDSKFGTTIKRVTDGWNEASPPQGYTHEYSQKPPNNIRHTRTLVTESITGGFRIIDHATGMMINPGIGGSDEPMWDGVDPDIIWFRRGNQVRKYNCATGVTTVVATFNGTNGLPSFTWIEFGGGSSDCSDDNDHLGIVGDSRYGLIYKISTGEISPVRDFLASEDIGQFNVTPNNRVSVMFNTIGRIDGTVSLSLGSTSLIGVGTSFLDQLQQGSVLQISGKFYNVASVESNASATLESPALATGKDLIAYRKRRAVLYDKNMNYVEVISHYTGHNTYGRDPSTGEEVLLIDAAGSEEGHPAGCGGNGLVRFNLGDPNPQATAKCFVGFPDFHLTGHYSWSNTRGSPWVALSLYDGRASSAGTARMNAVLRSDWASAWKRFYNELFIANIVTGEIRRLTHLRIRIPGILGYWFTSRAAISKDAAYIIFASAMGEFHHRAGAGKVTTIAGSVGVTGTSLFVSSTAPVILGGEITIEGETRNIVSIGSRKLEDGRIIDDSFYLEVDRPWSVSRAGVSYTAQNPDIVDVYRLALRPEATDFTPPVISGIKVGNVTATSATVSWLTDKPSTSQVEWGATTFYGGGITPYDTAKVTSHSVQLTGLPKGQIHFRVKSRDIPGNIKLSENQAFAIGDQSMPIEPAPSPTPTPSPSNVALAANGATASASSTFGTQSPAHAINGDRKGLNSGWWADNTSNAYPDWIEVSLGGSKTINEIDVFGLQQNPNSPVEPTPTMTSSYALTNFEVQYWTGSTWTTVPGGSVVGNDKVWRKFVFPPLATSKIRIWITSVAGDNRSQVVEIEAYAAPDSSPIPPPVPTPSPAEPQYEFKKFRWPSDDAGQDAIEAQAAKEGFSDCYVAGNWLRCKRVKR